MKQQLIQGLPEFLRTDAFVYNGPSCTYQRLVTYTACKFKAAKDVVELAKGSSKESERGRRSSFGPRPATPRPRLPMMAMEGMAGRQEIDQGPSGQRDGRATSSEWAYEPATRRHLAGRSPEARGPLRCYVCWEAGHMAHQCPKLSAIQRDPVVKARDAFLNSTRGHKKVADEASYRAQRDVNRRTRIAVVQALVDGIDQSDEEEDARREALVTRAKPAGPPPSSGEAQWGVGPRLLPAPGIVYARLLRLHLRPPVALLYSAAGPLLMGRRSTIVGPSMRLRGPSLFFVRETLRLRRPSS